MRNRTPSRFGVFLVDQTVPTTWPRNILSSSREDLALLAELARRGRDDRLGAHRDLAAIADCHANVVLADELGGRGGRRRRGLGCGGRGGGGGCRSCFGCGGHGF